MQFQSLAKGCEGKRPFENPRHRRIILKLTLKKLVELMIVDCN